MQLPAEVRSSGTAPREQEAGEHTGERVTRELAREASHAVRGQRERDEHGGVVDDDLGAHPHMGTTRRARDVEGVEDEGGALRMEDPRREKIPQRNEGIAHPAHRPQLRLRITDVAADAGREVTRGHVMTSAIVDDAHEV
jgi:hypothetical protein